MARVAAGERWVGGTEAPTLRRWAPAWLLGWEDWFTFALSLMAVLAVALAVEAAEWTRSMPPFWLIGLLGLLAGMMLARSALSWPLAWLLAAVLGAAVTFWQTLSLVDGADPAERIDQLYFRFHTWFQLAFSSGVSNDSLPFVTLMMGLTFGGSYFLAWSLFRWQQAWLGLLPGGAALAVSHLYASDAPLPLLFVFVLAALLLVMRTHLARSLRHWRSEGVAYPSRTSLSVAVPTALAAFLLVLPAWLLPADASAPTVGLAGRVLRPLEGVALELVRLGGPLKAKKVLPTLHDYTSILPFQGSIQLREVQLFSVEIDPPPSGTLFLRGATYDVYTPGGWKAGQREEVGLLPSPAFDSLARMTRRQRGLGRLVRATVEMSGNTAAGTVLITVGEPVAFSIPATAKVTPGSVLRIKVDPKRTHSEPQLALLERRVEEAILAQPEQASQMSDDYILRQLLSGLAMDGFAGVALDRDKLGRVKSVDLVPITVSPDLAVLQPEERLKRGQSYTTTGLVMSASPEQLRGAADYPDWVMQRYLQLPDRLPQRVLDLAASLAGHLPNAYDKAVAIQSYLRDNYPLSLQVRETPPGRDTIDHFLFEARQGYFDYHASAMAVLLRAVGVPARLAIGFRLESPEEEPEAKHIVEHRNAYAWTEVYFPGYGWQQFDPTPRLAPQDLASLSDLDLSLLDLGLLAGLGDLSSLSGSLSSSDLDYLAELAGLGNPDSSNQAGADGTAAQAEGGGPPLIPMALILVSVGGLLAALTLSLRLAWQRAAAGLPLEQQLWGKAVLLATWAGVRPGAGETPREFGRRLARRLDDVEGVEGLAEAYGRSRFGRRPAASGELASLQRVWQRLRNRLLRESVRRLWPWR